MWKRPGIAVPPNVAAGAKIEYNGDWPKTNSESSLPVISDITTASSANPVCGSVNEPDLINT